MRALSGVSEKIQNKYGELKGELLLIKLERSSGGLGLSLAGNRDRDKLSVFVVGIRDNSPLLSASRPIRLGDELLEVSAITGNRARMLYICNRIGSIQ